MESLPNYKTVVPPSIQLRDPQYIDEPKSVIYKGELVEASCFGALEIQALLEKEAGLSNGDLIKIWNAYNDLKAIFCGNNGPKLRRTGEPFYQHPKAVMLILLLELGVKDPETLIAALHHDSPEDSLLVRGNQNHERKDITIVKNRITTFDALSQRYNPTIAKILVSLRKTKNRDESTNKLLNKYPEIRKQAAEVKTGDRIHNLRTLPTGGKNEKGETAEEFAARIIMDSHNFILPVARIAGEKFYALLKDEIDERKDVLTLEQKSRLQEEHFELEYNIGYIARLLKDLIMPDSAQGIISNVRTDIIKLVQLAMQLPNKIKF